LPRRSALFSAQKPNKSRRRARRRARFPNYFRDLVLMIELDLVLDG
jgi:hypothetical protein